MRMGPHERRASRCGRARRARLPARRCRCAAPAAAQRLGPPPPRRRRRRAAKRRGSPATGRRRGCARRRRSTARGRADPLALASFAPVADADRPPLRRQRPHLHPPGQQARATARRPRSTAQPAARADRRPLRQQRPARRQAAAASGRATSSSSPPTPTAPRPSAPSSPTATTIFAPKQWVKYGNPNFDIGALLVQPNAEGVNVADAVGGGATIVTDLSRQQDFQTFGYPGKTQLHAELRLALRRRRHAHLPDPRPADDRRSAATGCPAPAAAAG